MKYRRSFITSDTVRYLVITATILLSGVASYSVSANTDLGLLFITVFVGLVVTLLILQNPYLGFVGLGVMPLVLDLWPRTPYLTSIALPLGGITFIAYVIRYRWRKQNVSGEVNSVPFISTISVFGLGFVFWIFVTYPEAALSLTGDRSWLFTFVQLFIYMWLASQFMTSIERHRIFMIVFAGVATISASIALWQAITGSFSDFAGRSGGLAVNPNSAAFQYSIAFLFLSYVISTVNSRVSKSLIYVGMVVLAVGVLSTVSRTGVGALVISIALLTTVRRSSGFNARRLIVIIILGASVVSLLPVDPISSLENRFNAGTEGGFSVDKRNIFWARAYEMFLDHPVAGVGVGNFTKSLAFYDISELDKLGVVHNTYLNALAENGVFGLLILIVMIVASIRACLKATRLYSDPLMKQLAMTWFLIWIVWLIFSITNNSQYDKFFWLLIGVSIFFRWQASLITTSVLENNQLLNA